MKTPEKTPGPRAAELEFQRHFFESAYKLDRDDPQVVDILAHIYTDLGLHTRGLAMDRRMVMLCPDNALAHYNLGCSLALTGDLAGALASIRHAVNLGYEDFQHMRQDADLKGLWRYAPFITYLKSIDEYP